ncbi:MAG: response regulator [Candidatus Margulisbacteria bacterium]|nr:response regulator [Candidatus Margulisiibacteriota bacterium]
MKKRTILIIDKDKEVENIVNAILKNVDKVETVQTGKEGLEKLHESSVMLVLTSDILPDMNGNDISIIVKTSKPYIPVIVMKKENE